jgi:hypothetical protein
LDEKALTSPCGECHTQQKLTPREAATYQSISGQRSPAVDGLGSKSLGEICRLLKDTAQNGGREARRKK